MKVNQRKNKNSGSIRPRTETAIHPLENKSQVYYILSYFSDYFKSIFPKNKLNLDN
nr:MAG TPA: hypothetical protein [Caudoviricetes sp.]